MKTFIKFVCFVFMCVVVASCASDQEKVEKLIRKQKYAEAREFIYDNCENVNYLIKKVADSELEDCYEDNDYRGLLEVKKEYKRDIKGIDFLCQKKFADNIKEILQRGNYDFIFSVFKDWMIKNNNLEKEETDRSNDSKDGEYWYENQLTNYESFDYDEITEGGSYYDNNRLYNFEVNYLNTLIDKTLETLIEEKDVPNIKKCVSFYKPYMLVKNKKYLSPIKVDEGFITKDIKTHYPIKYTMDLVNTDQEKALAMIKEAGIEL